MIVFLMNLLMQVMLPDCEKLPPIGSKGSETCFRIGIPHLAQIVEGRNNFTDLYVLNCKIANITLISLFQSKAAIMRTEAIIVEYPVVQLVNRNACHGITKWQSKHQIIPN